MIEHAMTGSELPLVRKNGTYRCAKCGVSVQYSVVLPRDMADRLPLPKFCDRCADAFIAEKNRQENAEILRHRQFDADIPDGFLAWDSKRGNNELLKKVLFITSQPQGIFIVGSNGCGKTSTSCEAARRYMLANPLADVKYLFYPDFAALVGEGSDGQRKLSAKMAAYMAADLLIVDDLANRMIISDAVGSNLVRLIDNIYKSGGKKRVYITSNIGEAGLKKQFENVDDCKRFIGRIKRMIISNQLAQLVARGGEYE